MPKGHPVLRRSVLIALLVFAPSAAMSIQQRSRPNLKAQEAAMKRIGFLVGDWEGDGWGAFGPAGRQEFRQTERIAYGLSGRIITIEGAGYFGGETEPSFQAFAVLSYDDRTGAYAFRSYAGGEAGTFEATLLDDGVFRWLAGSNTRYTIRLNQAGQWYEIGERRNKDGGWTTFLVMTLDRKAAQGRPLE